MFKLVEASKGMPTGLGVWDHAPTGNTPHRAITNKPNAVLRTKSLCISLILLKKYLEESPPYAMKNRL
jgi:hypothetical protein